VVFLGTIGTHQRAIDTRVQQLSSQAPQLVCVYEAGPCGSWRCRDRTKKHLICWVVAPARIPKQAGDRVNTDRRDAPPLARLRRAGELTPVAGPAVADEALRALARAREEAIRARKAAKNRVKAFRWRQDSRDEGRATWGPAPRRWLAAVVWPPPAQPMGFQEEVRAVTAPRERLQRWAQALHDQVTSWRLYPVVEARQARRGVQLTGAGTTVAELGDLTRVDTPQTADDLLGPAPLGVFEW
jgi:transposase